MTTRAQAKDTLSRMPGVVVEEVEAGPLGTMLRWNLGEGTATFDEADVVATLQLTVKSYDLSSTDVFGRYGEPSRLVFFDWDYGYITIFLLYPDAGMAAGFLTQDQSSTVGQKSIKLVAPQDLWFIRFFAADLEEFYTEARQPVEQFPWEGFTAYP